MTGPDINSLDLQNEVIETDSVTSEDFYRRLSPIDDGEHAMTAKLAQRGLEARKRKDPQSGRETPYLLVNAQLTSVEDEKKICFDTLTSIIFTTGAGKRTSRLHVFLEACGSPFQGSNLQELKDHCEQVLAGTPTLLVKTQWEAQYEDKAAKEKKDQYVTILKGQSKFPFYKDTDGNETLDRNPEVTDPKTGNVGVARAQVVSYKRA